MKSSILRFVITACISLIVIPLFLRVSLLPALSESQDFYQEEMKWREDRHKKMLSSSSWLSIAGLFWLMEGENTFGTSAGCRIHLPSGTAPPLAGKFIYHDGQISVEASPDMLLKIHDKPVIQAQLKGDETGKPDIIELQDLRMWIIKRGERYAIRLRDLNHPPFKNYQRLEYFPPSEIFKVQADYVAYLSPKKVIVETVIGTENEMVSPGYVKFTLQGREFQLIAFRENSKQLFIILRDQTSGTETYEASRYMYSTLLDNGKVDLNFNRAFNPPCAYTPYATCPLPPPKNELDIRIEAGEKTYPDSHH
jgi:uncharacterized protein (DUF1684 family)